MHIKAVLEELGLIKMTNYRIGQVGEGGISAEERHHISFGKALITDHTVIICEEFASGLDNYNAENVVRLFRALAHRRHTVIYIIQQPALNIYVMIADVL